MARKAGKLGSGRSSGLGRRGGLRGFGRKLAASRRTGGSRKKGGSGSRLEDLLVAQIKLAGLPAPDLQARLIPGRKFVHDLAWRSPWMLAVEVNGGTAMDMPSHMSVAGYERDCEKSALAQLQGYRTLAVTSAMVRRGRALALVEAFLRSIGSNSVPKTPGGAGCE